MRVRSIYLLQAYAGLGNSKDFFEIGAAEKDWFLKFQESLTNAKKVLCNCWILLHLDLVTQYSGALLHNYVECFLEDGLKFLYFIVLLQAKLKRVNEWGIWVLVELSYYDLKKLDHVVFEYFRNDSYSVF